MHNVKPAIITSEALSSFFYNTLEEDRDAEEAEHETDRQHQFQLVQRRADKGGGPHDFRLEGQKIRVLREKPEEPYLG